jgi:hypothetical protein
MSDALTVMLYLLALGLGYLAGWSRANWRWEDLLNRPIREDIESVVAEAIDDDRAELVAQLRVAAYQPLQSASMYKLLTDAARMIEKR